MTFAQFQAASRRTMADPNLYPPDMRKLIAALGLCGEAGEVGELIKKQVGHGHPVDDEFIVKLANEIGDSVFYAAYVCECYGLDLEAVVQGNRDKLERRYPNGFNFADSMNRSE